MQFISIDIALLLLEYLLIFPTMDTFNLEDDDANELFITQTSSNNNDGMKLIGSLADPMDFSSPCQSLLPASASKRVDFSDISDDEIFDIPCSQECKFSGQKWKVNILICRIFRHSGQFLVIVLHAIKFKV